MKEELKQIIDRALVAFGLGGTNDAIMEKSADAILALLHSHGYRSPDESDPAQIADACSEAFDRAMRAKGWVHRDDLMGTVKRPCSEPPDGQTCFSQGCGWQCPGSISLPVTQEMVEGMVEENRQLRESLKNCRSSIVGYCVLHSNTRDEIIALVEQFYHEIKRIEKVAEQGLQIDKALAGVG
jgi:hypothetical protein